MFLGTISPQPIRSNLKLARGKSKRQERENPDDNPNGISVETLQRADIHSLRTGNG